MARNTTTATAAPIDVKALAKGIGAVKQGPGYARIEQNGRTIAYVKARSIAVPASLVAKAPTRLGTFKVEANGRWASARVADTAAARRILEFVAKADA